MARKKEPDLADAQKSIVKTALRATKPAYRAMKKAYGTDDPKVKHLANLVAYYEAILKDDHEEINRLRQILGGLQ